MRCRKSILNSLYLLLCWLPVKANTFVVTTNADSGPGSLRAAIEQANANGSLVTDTILFSISDLTEPGRTIALRSSLRINSSRIVIDGSTQPGTKFGVSDARIKIEHSGFGDFTQALIINNASDIEIYSLFFSSFRYNEPANLELKCAIYLVGRVSGLKIGRPGKGNVFHQNTYGIVNNRFRSTNPEDLILDLEIKSNFFGLNEYGNGNDMFASVAIALRSVQNIGIGGSVSSEGNFFATYGTEILLIECDKATNNGYLNILNNNFGRDYSLVNPVKCGTLKIAGSQSSPSGIIADLVVTISKNKFDSPLMLGSNSCYTMVRVDDIGGFVAITGNEIGLLSTFLACQSSGINISNCENGIIGGPNPGDKNIISRNFNNGIYLFNNRNFTVQENSIFCNRKGISASSSKVVIPRVDIMTENGGSQVGGTATPNCKIEIFETPQCAGCENGEIFLGQTISDNAGNWTFNGVYSNAVTATATTINGVTGEFAIPEFAEAIDIKYPVCGKSNGHIKGTRFLSGTKYYWVKWGNPNDTIFNQLDLENLGPGLYEFTVEQTRYCKKSYRVSLEDLSPKIDSRFADTRHPSCGRQNGHVTNIFVRGSYQQLYWLNENRDTVARGQQLAGVGPGRYKLIVVNTEHGCGDSTDYFTLINQVGPSLNTGSLQIKPATCGNANGSITGMSFSNSTGSVFCFWQDSLFLNSRVGVDLINVPGGKYRFVFVDQSGCDTIKTNYYTVPDSGRIVFDSSQLRIKPSGCLLNNGSITGMRIAGATSYHWINSATQTIVSNGLDLINMPAGNYQLIAVNTNFNCSAQSAAYNIVNASPASIQLAQVTFQHANCKKNNGVISIDSIANNPGNFNFEWLKDSSQLVGTGRKIQDLAPGRYQCIAIDSNGCRQQVYAVSILMIPPPQVDESTVFIKPDTCSLSVGLITVPGVSSGSGNLRYTWFNENNQPISTNKTLLNVKEGNYYLQVTDDQNCPVQTRQFYVPNINFTPDAPVYNDITVPKGAAITIKPTNPAQGNYSLFSNPAGGVALQHSPQGEFNIPPLFSDIIYYVELRKGNCLSTRTEIKIKVVEESKILVPNAFTPNNDGRNDGWGMRVIGIIKLKQLRIYNRWGQVIFETADPSLRWYGMLNGKPVPAGTYVWTIEATDYFGKPIRQNGTVTLLR